MSDDDDYQRTKVLVPPSAMLRVSAPPGASYEHGACWADAEPNSPASLHGIGCVMIADGVDCITIWIRDAEAFEIVKRALPRR